MAASLPHMVWKYVLQEKKELNIFCLSITTESGSNENVALSLGSLEKIIIAVLTYQHHVLPLTSAALPFTHKATWAVDILLFLQSRTVLSLSLSLLSLVSVHASTTATIALSCNYLIHLSVFFKAF
jgi:hypothetical protein